MISYLEGQVLLAETGYAVIKTNGVGYHVLMGKTDCDGLTIGHQVELFVHTYVREDAIELYGFSSLAKRRIFLMLISVSGIGPKLALAMLSAMPHQELVRAIIGNDHMTLATIPGIGKKTAERIVLELKDKALKIDPSIFADNVKPNSLQFDLEQAIRSLGYSKSQSDKAISSLNQQDISALPLEILIKKALTILSGNIPS